MQEVCSALAFSPNSLFQITSIKNVSGVWESSLEELLSLALVGAEGGGGGGGGGL